MTPTKLYPKRKAFLFIDTSNEHSIPVLKDVFLSICLYMTSGKVPCMVLRNYNNSTVKKKSLLRDFLPFWLFIQRADQRKQCRTRKCWRHL